MSRTDATILAAQKTNSITPYVPIYWWYRFPGRATSTTANKLVDSNAVFSTWGVQVGWTVTNRTDGTSTTVSAVDSETQLSLNSDIFTVGEFYTIESTTTRIDNLSSVDRIIEVSHNEQGFFTDATIKLFNHDSAFDSYNSLGKWFKIGRGIGSDVSYPAYLKCFDDYYDSNIDNPKDTYVIECGGMWEILENYYFPGSTNQFDLYFNQADSNTDYPEVEDMTGKEIIDFVLKLAGMKLGTDISLDTYINVSKPEITMTSEMNGKEFILKVLSFFRCSLLPRVDYGVLLLTNTGDSSTYVVPEDGTYQPFINGRKRRTLPWPLKANIESYFGEYSGSYISTDPLWTEDMGSLFWVDYFGVATSNDACEKIAQAQVEKAQAQSTSGFISTWVADCLAELYDTSTFTDNRGNISGSGVNGSISFHYKPGESHNFYTDIGIGGAYNGLEGFTISNLNRRSDWRRMYDGGTPTNVEWGPESPFGETITYARMSNIYRNDLSQWEMYIVGDDYAYRYNFTTKVWTAIAAPPTGDEIQHTPCVYRNGKLYATSDDNSGTEIRGRRISIYDPTTDSWSQSSQAPNIGASVSYIHAFCFEDDDTIWAWCSIVTPYLFQCMKYVISTDTWSSFVNSLNPAGAIDYPAPNAAYDSGVVYHLYPDASPASDLRYVTYTIATDTYAESAASGTDYSYMYAQAGIYLPYRHTDNKRIGYFDCSDQSWHDDFYPLNSITPNTFRATISDDLAIALDYIGTSSPQFYSYDQDGYYLLGILTVGDDGMFVYVEKPTDSYGVICVNTSKNISQTMYNSQQIFLSSGQWKFYYPQAGDYTQLIILYKFV